VSLTGFLFAAPGGVYILNNTDQRRMGIIALAGPAINLALAVLSMILAQVVPALRPIALLSASINAWLGLFNLIPFNPLDGAKVFRWNRWVFSATIIPAGIIMFLTKY
ncbi:MAG: hypothetical protein Q7K43_03795, partial [Candidatus Woesearchaeota archaeon]|nr:hypothetical protein [Candidatus Woesearchaeota archaeon]